MDRDKGVAVSRAFDFLDFVLGVVVGWSLAMTLAYTLPNSYYNVYKDATAKCEENLPRNQKCVIVAIPKEVK
jgi:hypothetical protein